MAQIDRLLTAMINSGGGTLMLDEGAPARVDVAGDQRTVTRAPLTGQQIASLVREFAPEGSVENIEPGRPAQFTYISETGAYSARAAREGGRWRVSLVCADRAATAPALQPPGPRLTPISLEDVVPIAPDSAADHRNGLTVVRADSAVPPINVLLTETITLGASDLHIRCGEPPIVRKDGAILRLDRFGALSEDDVKAVFAATMPQLNRGEFEMAADTDFAYEITGEARFRVNAFRDRKGPGAVFRQIPPNVVTAEQLGLSSDLQRLTQLTKGLVIVTGPTGSGKSTTLCALIDLANRTRSDHIVTIEDPIEFVHESKRCVVTQRQVGEHTRSFKAALRAALREDPDVVLIGEMRDLETVSIALETAETGHLVFATLHTTTAAGTVDRIIDQFPSDQQDQIRVMLADSLRAVLSQTLCKKIGGGRVAAREVLFNTPPVSNLIRERKTFQISSIMQTSKRFGMVTLNDALVELIETQQVTSDEAYTHAVDKAGFVGALKAKGLDVSFAEPDALNARMSGTFGRPSGEGDRR